MSGGRVVALLLAIVFATAVVPPAAAWAVNRYRLTGAAKDVARLAERLGFREREPRMRMPDSGILVGPGRMPATETPLASRWGTAPRAEFAAALSANEPLPIDPWGNCYLSNLEAGSADQQAAVWWVLSAGPNGIIDTPFSSTASEPAGDDVAAQVR